MNYTLTSPLQGKERHDTSFRGLCQSPPQHYLGHIRDQNLVSP